jgi:hypothetical protein
LKVIYTWWHHWRYVNESFENKKNFNDQDRYNRLHER